MIESCIRYLVLRLLSIPEISEVALKATLKYPPQIPLQVSKTAIRLDNTL